ncbi:MAG: hypothetical protein ACPG4K_06040 [Haloferula sp.]
MREARRFWFGMVGRAMVLGGLVCLLSVSLSAQDGANPAASEPSGSVEGGSSADQTTEDLQALKNLAPALVLAKEDLDEAKQALERAATQEEREELEQTVNEQRVRVAELRDDFRTLASGIEEATYLGTEPESVSLKQSLEDILEPISRGVREATEEPREMDELRRNLETAEGHLEMSQDALDRLTKLLDLAESESIIEELKGAEEMWSKRLARAQSQIAVLDQQIKMREGDQQSTFERLSGFFQQFWRSRGLNLVLAVLAAVAAVMIVRRGYRLLKRLGRGKVRRGAAGRTMDLAVEIFSVFAAVAALVLVFYLRGDWLLLALTVLAVVGVLWASKTALPPYIDQIKLILNLGSVREGERLVHDGVPWRVKRLNFQCHFENPELDGGQLRLPIRDVMPLHSRPADAKEPWFPSRKDDWVILSDDTYGKVIEQTPEQVVVLRLGGSLKTYPTSDFLELAPENLSRGYRIQVVFGIDYEHQSIATTEVPKVFKERIEQALLEEVGEDGLRSVKVQFTSAAASSLDYAILVDCDGSLGSRRNHLKRVIQATCVDICNDQGWGIPFQQITLHQAG